MEAVFAKKLITSNTETPGGKTTPGSRDSGSKMARDAILDGITGGRLSDSDKTRGDKLYKHAKLLPRFPGLKCKTVPEVWEDWWEEVFGIQNVLEVNDLTLAYMIKETATKDSDL